MKKLYGWLLRCSELAGAICFACILLFYVIDLLSIPIAGSALMWSREFARFACVFATFLMCGPLLHRGRHISIDLLPLMLKGLPLAINNFFISLIILAVAVMVTYYGYEAVAIIYRAGPVYRVEIDLPMWITFASAPVGMLFAIFVGFRMLIGSVRSIVDSIPRRRSSP